MFATQLLAESRHGRCGKFKKRWNQDWGLRFASKPHAWAFFYRSVLKHVKIKRRTTRKRRLEIVDKHYGNPIDEYEESMKLAYEDSLSEAMLR